MVANIANNAHITKTCFAALDDLGINVEQKELQALLVNKSDKVRKSIEYQNIYSNLQPVSEGRWPTEYNGTGIRFQDPTSLKWFYLTIGVSISSLDDFKKMAETSSGIDWEEKLFFIALHCF